MVKEFLSQQGVEFSVKNVATDERAREEFLRAGYRLPPVTVIVWLQEALPGSSWAVVQELATES